MRNAISIFKILSVVSFLALIVPNEKFSVPMVLWLFVTFTAFAGLSTALFSILISFALFYIYVTSFNPIADKYDIWFSLMSILILVIAASISMVNVFNYSVFSAYLTHFICLFFLVITLILIYKKHLKQPPSIIQHQWHHQHQQLFIFCLLCWFDNSCFCGRT